MTVWVMYVCRWVTRVCVCVFGECVCRWVTRVCVLMECVCDCLYVCVCCVCVLRINVFYYLTGCHIVFVVMRASRSHLFSPVSLST